MVHFENELKEKLLTRYTVVFFPIQSNIFICSLITETRLVIFVMVSIVLIFISEGYSRAKLFIDYFS